MLPFDSYEANKIALSVAHIDVSSGKSHKRDKIYSHPQKKKHMFYTTVTQNTTDVQL
jgi:hypothetical protein